MKKIYCELISGALIIWRSKLLKRMRIVALLILITITQTFAFDSYAQSKRLSLNFKNEEIINILDAIEKQSEFYFMFDASKIDVTQSKSIDCENRTITSILDQLFENTGITYRISDRQIGLISTEFVNTEQDMTVSGKVTDSSGQPLPGVTVVVKGTTQGTITDSDGKYTLTNTPDDATLQFSFVGMKSQEVVVGTQTSINIILELDAIGIEEVVAIGYGTMKKSDLTGAVSKVQSEDLVNRSITRPEQALQGKTAGVQIIQTSGAPGSSPAVRVRGFSSNVATPPLYIVDGLRTNDIGLIDPNNIESMEVLKDAASAAIYGAEAGNGVIIITTRKGKKGEGRISYNYQMVTNELTDLPKLMNAEQYINYMTEGNLISQDNINSSWDGHTDTNWADATFEKSMMMKHNLSFEGGNDRGSFNASLSYLNNDGIVKGKVDYLERISGMLNADYKIKDWLKIGTNNIFEHWKGRSVGENRALSHKLCKLKIPRVATLGIFLFNFKTLHRNEKRRFIK